MERQIAFRGMSTVKDGLGSRLDVRTEIFLPTWSKTTQKIVPQKGRLIRLRTIEKIPE